MLSKLLGTNAKFFRKERLLTEYRRNRLKYHGWTGGTIHITYERSELFRFRWTYLQPSHEEEEIEHAENRNVKIDHWFSRHFWHLDKLRGHDLAGEIAINGDDDNLKRRKRR